MLGLKSQLGLSLFKISVTVSPAKNIRDFENVCNKTSSILYPVNKNTEKFLKVSTCMFPRRGIARQVWNDTRMIAYRKHTEAPTLIDKTSVKYSNQLGVLSCNETRV